MSKRWSRRIRRSRSTPSCSTSSPLVSRWKGEAVWRCRNGERCEIQQTITPIRDRFNAVTHALWALQSITGRKRLEELAVDESREFECFFTFSPDLACIASTDGSFKKVNPAWEDALGY